MRGKMRLIFVFAVMLVASAAMAYDYGWVAFLNGANERPTPNNSPATGTWYGSLSADCDTFYYYANWQDLTTTYTASHVHKGAANQAGGVVHGLQNAGQFGTPGGAWAIPAVNFGDLHEDSLYVNVHTQQYPGGEIRGQIECWPDTAVWDAQTDVGESQCLQLCDDVSSWIIIDNVPEGFYPVVVKRLGCSLGSNPCDVNCCPATFIREFFNGQWWDGMEYDWWNYGNDVFWLEVQGDGCICVTLEQILAVELGTFDAVPGNNQVTLNWTTLSETDNDHFEVTRDNQLVANVPGAGNSSSGNSYQWVDSGVENGTPYTYRLYSVSVNGNREELASESVTPTAAVITGYALHANYPNPFNPETLIRFDLAESGHVTLSVFDLMGREVANVVNGTMSQGSHAVTFQAGSLPSGVYVYRLDVNGFSDQRKMLLLK